MTGVITSFGPLGVFMLMVPESACIPIPSEVTLLFSGFAVSQHWMSFALAVLAATAGNLAGSLLAYAVGARHWHTRLPGAGPLFRRADELLDRHGLKAIFIARLLPLARTFVSLPAGARHTPLLPFTLLTTAGCALWAAAFVLAGLLSGTAWASVNSVLGKVLLGAILAALAVAAHRHSKRR
jgi:membrane protein DedA with SNARE-associated domain